MELDARLRAFAALARRSSFSRAAEELGISQPAVSRPEAGSLRVAASSTPGTYLLPRALASFAPLRPGIELEVHSVTSGRAAELVRGHRVDLGLVGGFAAAFDLDGAPLLEDEIVIIGPPALAAHGVTARELAGRTWIHREEGSATRAAMEAGWSAAGIAPRRRLVLETWEAIKLAVAQGDGVAAISSLALEQELRGGTLVVTGSCGAAQIGPVALSRAGCATVRLCCTTDL